MLGRWAGVVQRVVQVIAVGTWWAEACRGARKGGRV